MNYSRTDKTLSSDEIAMGNLQRVLHDELALQKTEIKDQSADPIARKGSFLKSKANNTRQGRRLSPTLHCSYVYRCSYFGTQKGIKFNNR